MTETIKVVLSNRAYLKPTPELKERMHTNLVYENKGGFKGAALTYVYNYGPVMKDTYWMPVERMDLLQDMDVTYVDKRLKVKTIFPEPGFTLREDQQAVVDEVNDTMLLNAAPGWGKSIAAMAIACKLGQKTLIVCTTTTIRDMWIREITKFFGAGAVGMVGSGKIVTDKSFTVGNIQTLTRKPERYSGIFGTIIFDEAHHTPATTFTKLLFASRARYKIGLSGTLYRKDGLHAAFKDYFGFNVIQPAIANTINPIVHAYDSGVEFQNNHLIPWADRVTQLTNNEMYRREVLALSAIYVKLGHKVIIVSDRVDFLKYINDNTTVRSELFIGETDFEDREGILDKMTNGELDMLAASQNIFSEGISQNNLSCMLLCTPISDNRALLSQLAGRIMRLHPDKLPPILVDFNLKGIAAKAQANKRKSIYKMFGWNILSMDLQSLMNQAMQMPT